MYPLSRNLRSSARLSLQHLFWNLRLGFLLHPAIPLGSSPVLCIADIGTGTAIWPLELSQHVSPKSKVIGYDISSSQFPAKEQLPSNVQLEILNVMGGFLPRSAVSAFDIVHVRALVLAVKRGDLDLLISRLGMMLKPGGYLQWDEVDLEAYRARSSIPTVSKTASEQFVQYFLEYMRSLNLSLDWVSQLPDHLARHGFELVDGARLHEADAVTCKLETDDHLMVLEDQLPDIATFMASEQGRASADVKQELERLFRNVVRETERGVSLHMDWYCHVARKL